MANPGVSGVASIEDPFALSVDVLTSGAHGTLLKVGMIAGARVVLRVEPQMEEPLGVPTSYLVYLDVQQGSGEWERLHRSVIRPRWPHEGVALEKHE